MEINGSRREPWRVIFQRNQSRGRPPVPKPVWSARAIAPGDSEPFSYAAKVYKMKRQFEKREQSGNCMNKSGARQKDGHQKMPRSHGVIRVRHLEPRTLYSSLGFEVPDPEFMTSLDRSRKE